MIITGKTTSPSAQALAARLPNWPGTVRWGGAHTAGAVQGQVLLRNGLEQLQAFQAQGIPCPEFTTDYQQALAWAQREWVLGRNLRHSQGFDIIPHQAKQRFASRSAGIRFSQKDFWVKLVQPVQTEWRVHIMRSAKTGTYYSIGMGAKTQVSVIQSSATQAGIPIRSRRLGWHLRHDLALPNEVRRVAKDTCAALAYDFGAVDILQKADGTVVVLEVNSCPALRDDYTLGRYADALVKYHSVKAGS